MVKMEKGANASNGLSTWDKKSSSNSGLDVARSMKFHSTEAFLSKGFMTGANLDRPFDGGTAAGGGGGSRGPTGSSTLGGANEDLLGNINRDDAAAAYASSSSRGAAAANFAKSSSSCNSSTNLQPFDMFPPAYSTAPFKSPGGMAATVGFPFTSAQWGELERQAMIYKYMMCSVPVPPELLFPLTKSYPAPVDSSASSLYNVRYSRNGDPEPGRCKRTDGKKWRCSRDVAPHQKYCERHLHRGRPRSRKPVEVKSNGESHKKTRLEQGRPVPLSSSVPAATSTAAASQQVVAASEPPLMLFNPKPDSTSISAVDGISHKGANRELGLMNMEAGMASMNGDEQRWQLLMGPNMGFGGEGSSIYGCSPLFDQDYVEQQPPLNVFPYTNASASRIEAPAGFIDAWSIDYSLHSGNNGNAGSTNQGSHSPSLNLSMAMAVGNMLDEGMGKVQFEGSVECHNEQSSKNSSDWLGPVSWLPFARGGPLAEALQPGANPASPHDSIGTPATTVSSPSGVLQRTFFSHSDSSVCNSPTFAAHASEVAFPRFNQMD